MPQDIGAVMIIKIKKCRVCGCLFCGLLACPKGCKKTLPNIYGEYDVPVEVPDRPHCPFDCVKCDQAFRTGSMQGVD